MSRVAGDDSYSLLLRKLPTMCSLVFVIQPEPSCTKVLLMQWNSHFDWDCGQFHFVELFAGAAHTSRAWI